MMRETEHSYIGTELVSRHISAVSLTEYMCESKNTWERVAKYMKYTLTTLEVDRQEVIID
jgi:hypothetical protein